MKRWVQLARNLSSFSAGDFIYHGDLYTRVVYIPWNLYTMVVVVYIPWYRPYSSLYTMVVVYSVITLFWVW
jgi:hypothetical protein